MEAENEENEDFPVKLREDEEALETEVVANEELLMIKKDPECKMEDDNEDFFFI